MRFRTPPDPTRPEPSHSVRHGFHAGHVDWSRDVSHGSTTKAHGFKHVIVCALIRWLVLGPSYFPENVVRFCYFCSVCSFFALFYDVRAKKIKRRPHSHFNVSGLPSPWVDAIITLTRWLLLPSRRAGCCAASGPGKQPSCAASGSKHS